MQVLKFIVLYGNYINHILIARFLGITFINLSVKLIKIQNLFDFPFESYIYLGAIIEIYSKIT
jgi:hypothetical protein